MAQLPVRLGIQVHFSQLLSENQTLHFIELEDPRGSFAYACFTTYYTIIEFEMLLPTVYPWVEKADKRFFIMTKCADIGTFRIVTLRAAISQIVQFACTTMFDASNVLNMKRIERHSFGQQAILTTKIGPVRHFPFGRKRDCSTHYAIAV